MSPTYYQNTTAMGNSVADKLKWVFASSLSPGANNANIREVDPTKQAGETGYTANKWIALTAPASITGQPMSVNFTALAASAGVTLPTGMGVVARSAYGAYALNTPFLQWQPFPQPSDLFCMGWGDFALLNYHGQIHVLRTPLNNQQTWTLIKTIGKSSVSDLRRAKAPTFWGMETANLAAVSELGPIQSLMIVPVGFDDLYLKTPGGEFPVRTRETYGHLEAQSAHQCKVGPWWIAAAPNQKMFFQVQSVSYDEAANITLGSLPFGDQTTHMFDLGDNYKPTVDPSVYAQLLFHPSVSAATHVPFSNGSGYALAGTNGLFNEIAEIQLVNEFHSAWDSDGAHQKGSVRIRLVPGDDVLAALLSYSFGSLDCISPQVRLIDVRFPPVRTARTRTALNLDDTQFQSLVVSTSYREPAGKTLKIRLTDAGLQTLVNASVDARHDFPVHVTEDTVGDLSYATTRIRAWISTMDVELLTLVGNSVTAPIQVYQIEAHGLMQRMEDSPWIYLPTIVDAANKGAMSHTIVPYRAFEQSGFDPDDTTFCYIETDGAEDLVKHLPGASADDPGESGSRNDSPWAPTYDEAKATYVGRVAAVWRGWVWWEKLGGQMRYEHNIVDDHAISGTALTTNATLYATHADATAAGRTGQVYQAHGLRQCGPIMSNFVRVMSKDKSGNVVANVIDRDSLSVTDSTSANFTGEYVRPVVVQPKLAIGMFASRQIARLYRRRVSRRTETRKERVMLAPWAIGASGVDAGSILLLNGISGQRLCVHLESETAQPRTDKWITTLTLEKLPPIASFGE